MSRQGVTPTSPAMGRSERLSFPDQLLIPSAVSGDQPAPEWINQGTTVARGDALAATGASVPLVRAPADGRMGQAKQTCLAGGGRVHAVEFTPIRSVEDEVKPVDLAVHARRLADVTPERLGLWIDRLRLRGLWIDRWTSPNLLGQMLAVLRRPVDRVVLNVLDSDPWLSLNGAMVVNHPVEVASGVGLLMRLTGAAQSWALVDQAESSSRLDGLRQAAKVLASGLRIAPMENDYPQPDPSLVVYATCRRRLKPGRLPTDQGVMLLDAAAAAAIGREVGGVPFDGRVPVVVYDQPDDLQRWIDAPIGMTVGQLMEQVGVPMAVREVYAGSPLRQRRVRGDDVIGGGETTFFAAPPQPVVASDPCVRCGWCIEGCPTRCRPAGLLEAAQRQDLELARHHGLDACIECGLCTYVCPSRLQLLQGIRQLRVLADSSGSV